jgi:DNA-binding NtrC family response regulator
VNHTNDRSVSILVIDDEEPLLELLCAVLTNEGYRCIAAASPAEAISACHRGDAIDLVVSDFNLPTMDGLRLQHAIRELRPNLDVLFISGNPDACDMLATEGFPCLQKPFPFAELTSVVHQILTGARKDQTGEREGG